MNNLDSGAKRNRTLEYVSTSALHFTRDFLSTFNPYPTNVENMVSSY
jgi:hypothetical protein